MKLSKGLGLWIITVLIFSVGSAYAASLWSATSRIHITKPEGVSVKSVIDIPLRWGDRFTWGEDDGSCGVTGGTMATASLVIPFSLTNNNSQNIELTWASVNVPLGMTVRLNMNTTEWVKSYVIPRGETVEFNLVVEDDGSMAVGDHVFDIIFSSQ
jgi:hypothetical protein